MHDPALTFFTHEIDGITYLAWYRVLSAACVEVQAIGVIETIRWDGVNPETAARTCLEAVIRQRIGDGKPVPGISNDPSEDAEPTSGDDR